MKRVMEEEEKRRRKKKKNGGKSGGREGERMKYFTPPSFPFYSPYCLPPPLPLFPPTSSPPAMPLTLRLRGRMMMNRLAARKQNISSRPGIGNWLSTSAEP